MIQFEPSSRGFSKGTINFTFFFLKFKNCDFHLLFLVNRYLEELNRRYHSKTKDIIGKTLVVRNVIYFFLSKIVFFLVSRAAEKEEKNHISIEFHQTLNHLFLFHLMNFISQFMGLGLSKTSLKFGLYLNF